MHHTRSGRGMHAHSKKITDHVSETTGLPCPGVGGIYIPSTGGAVAAAHADGVVVFGVGIGRESERRGNLDGLHFDGLHWISGVGWGSKGVMKCV